jgi:hypothetical protein
MAAETSDRSKINVVWVLSNLLTSQNPDICIGVIFRARVLSFLDSIKKSVPNDLLFTLPRLVLNIVKKGPVPGMTHTNLTSLVILLGNLLNQLKQVKKKAPYKAADAERTIDDILKAVKSLQKSKSLKGINVQELQWLLSALEES